MVSFENTELICKEFLEGVTYPIGKCTNNPDVSALDRLG